MSKPESDPFWRSPTVRAVLLWAGLGLSAWVASMIVADHERMSRVEWRLDALAAQISDLKQDIAPRSVSRHQPPAPKDSAP